MLRAAGKVRQISCPPPLLNFQFLARSKSNNCYFLLTFLENLADQDPEFPIPNEQFRFGIIPAGSTDAIVMWYLFSCSYLFIYLFLFFKSYMHCI